jgi:trk system potassium uptake protein
MRIIIIGAGKAGTFLCERLHARHQVTVVDQRPDRTERIASRMPDLEVVRGDACEPAMLDVAGVAAADLLIATTGDDEDNLVVSWLASRQMRAPMIVARVNHPANAWLFTKQWGVDVAVSSAAIMYDLVEKELNLGDMITVLRLQAEGTSIDEITLPESAGAVGRTLAEVNMPSCAQVMAIISGGKVTVPRGETVLAAGDQLLLLSECRDTELVRDALGCPGTAGAKTGPAPSTEV